MDIHIFVATHKKFSLLGDPEIYIPMQGGAALYPEQRFGYMLDCTGDNISMKKENYNELTSLYWAWKNDFSDIIGLCHYRRYLTKNEGDFSSDYIYGRNDIESVLTNYSVILPYPHRHKGTTNRYWLNHLIRKENVEKLSFIIQNKYPDYFEDFNTIMNRDYACYCNILISHKHIIDEYCNWLFPILSQLEDMVDTSDFSTKEQRYLGYVAEYLLNVYFHHRKVKKGIKYVPMLLYIDNTEFRFKKIKKILGKTPLFELLKHRSFYFRHTL